MMLDHVALESVSFTPRAPIAAAFGLSWGRDKLEPIVAAAEAAMKRGARTHDFVVLYRAALDEDEAQHVGSTLVAEDVRVEDLVVWLDAHDFGECARALEAEAPTIGGLLLIVGAVDVEHRTLAMGVIDVHEQTNRALAH